MSADDGGASGSGIGPTGLRRENAAAVFATTHWSVVLEAQGESPAAQDALEKLCRTFGDLFMLSCGGKVSGQRRQRILPRGFLRMNRAKAMATRRFLIACPIRPLHIVSRSLSSSENEQLNTAEASQMHLSWGRKINRFARKECLRRRDSILGLAIKFNRGFRRGQAVG